MRHLQQMARCFAVHLRACRLMKRQSARASQRIRVKNDTHTTTNLCPLTVGFHKTIRRTDHPIHPLILRDCELPTTVTRTVKAAIVATVEDNHPVIPSCQETAETIEETTSLAADLMADSPTAHPEAVVVARQEEVVAVTITTTIEVDQAEVGTHGDLETLRCSKCPEKNTKG
jgi:hypothetical protein